MLSMPVVLVAANVAVGAGHLLAAERPADDAPMLPANLRRVGYGLFVVGDHRRDRLHRMRLAGRDDDAMERGVVLRLRGRRIGPCELDGRVALGMLRMSGRREWI